MLNGYDDIRSRIPEPPQWWDENGVPRYVAFAPSEVANIYACEAALVGIECQACQTRFKVAFSFCMMDRVRRADAPTLTQQIAAKTIHYGDPPNADCCPAGPTMNSEPKRVLEYWSRADGEWTRDPALEIDVEDGWD